MDDEMFDLDAVAAGVWVPGPYGEGDQRGSLNEVTPERTAAALRILDLSRPVHTYSLSEELFNGFPAWGDREYEQRLVITGYDPPPGFEGVVTDPTPQGANRNSINEERVSLTFNLGSKVTGLHHCGVAGLFYNGFRGSDIAAAWGTTALGNETGGPVVTRGVLLDVLGLKIARGDDAELEADRNGEPLLRERYRITVEDIEEVLRWEGIGEPGPGDVVLFRTGWRQLIATDPGRYLEGEPPGPYLREIRYLGARRPAIVGSDTWVFEVLDAALTQGKFVPCHQELYLRYGIRVGEAIRTDALAGDGVYEFVVVYNPLPARGATASNSPLTALGQPRGG